MFNIRPKGKKTLQDFHIEGMDLLELSIKSLKLGCNCGFDLLEIFS